MNSFDFRHCGSVRTSGGVVIDPPVQDKSNGETAQQFTRRHAQWLNGVRHQGVTSSRCACDPDHPHQG